MIEQLGADVVAADWLATTPRAARPASASPNDGGRGDDDDAGHHDDLGDDDAPRDDGGTRRHQHRRDRGTGLHGLTERRRSSRHDPPDAVGELAALPTSMTGTVRPPQAGSDNHDGTVSSGSASARPSMRNWAGRRSVWRVPVARLPRGAPIAMPLRVHSTRQLRRIPCAIRCVRPLTWLAFGGGSPSSQKCWTNAR